MCFVASIQFRAPVVPVGAWASPSGWHLCPLTFTQQSLSALPSVALLCLLSKRPVPWQQPSKEQPELCPSGPLGIVCGISLIPGSFFSVLRVLPPAKVTAIGGSVSVSDF